ncbi:MAG: flavin reductase family protein [Promethearchaeia archaeon]
MTQFKKLASADHIGLLHPRQTILCTVKHQDKANIITLAWTMIISRRPPIVAISVAPQRYSHDLIKKSKLFTINIPTKDILADVFYCGSHSGRNEDKFKKTNLTPLEGISINCPRIKECIAHLECKVIDENLYGDHTLFVGKVVACAGRCDILKNNKTDVSKLEIPYHLTGRNFTFNQKDIHRVRS